MGCTKHIKKYWFYYLPISIWVIHLIIIFFFVPQVPIKDERTFFSVAISFKNIDLQGFIALLKTYEAPQTPLVFLIAGFLLKLSTTIIFLRLFNSIYIFISLVFFCKSIDYFQIVPLKHKLLFAVTLLLNPYFHFAAVTFYTDGLYLMLISISAFLIVANKEKLFLFISFFFLPLVRQFGIFLPVGYFLNEIKSSPPFVNKKTLYTLISFSGFLLILFIWKNIMPDNSFREMMLTIRQKYGYVLPYIPAYIFSAIGFYLSPLFLIFISKVIKEKMFYIGGVVISLFYIMFPIHQNYTNMLFQENVTTLGFYHKLMQALLGNPAFNFAIVLFAFISGGWIFVLFYSDKVPRILKIIISLYFAMNLFNLQAWDKYIIDIEIILLLTIIYFLKDFIKGQNPSLKS